MNPPHDFEKTARELCPRGELNELHKHHSVCLSCAPIATALRTAVAQSVEDAARELEEVHVLDIISDWEDGEDIARSVQKYLVAKLRKGQGAV